MKTAARGGRYSNQKSSGCSRQGAQPVAGLHRLAHLLERPRFDLAAQSYVIDPRGRLRLLVRHDRIAQDLAADLRALLRDTVR